MRAEQLTKTKTILPDSKLMAVATLPYPRLIFNGEHWGCGWCWGFQKSCFWLFLIIVERNTSTPRKQPETTLFFSLGYVGHRPYRSLRYSRCSYTRQHGEWLQTANLKGCSHTCLDLLVIYQWTITFSITLFIPVLSFHLSEHLFIYLTIITMETCKHVTIIENNISLHSLLSSTR